MGGVCVGSLLVISCLMVYMNPVEEIQLFRNSIGVRGGEWDKVRHILCSMPLDTPQTVGVIEDKHGCRRLRREEKIADV